MKTKIITIIVLTLCFIRIAQLEAKVNKLQKMDRTPDQGYAIPQVKEYSI